MTTVLRRPLRQRRPPPASSRLSHIPAPVGGLNTVDTGFQMPDSDCPLLFNLIGAENGIRSRLGSTEWCTNLTGATDNTVRTVLPFTGSHKNGTTNKLFACTSTGIWDVSASSALPSRVVTFGTQTGDAGYGIGAVVVNASGGHFLVYCDEENGYYVYTEATNSWTKVTQAASAAWATGTVYAAGARVSNGGLTYKTVAGGTSAASGTGPSGTGNAIPDNTVTWQYEPTISGVDPSTFTHALVWKNRLWFTQRDTGTAWYLEPAFGAGGALFGPATSFNFGAQFKAGGFLVGLWNWSLDGGSGPDDMLVAISSGGDLVVYKGVNPGSAATFGLVNRWYVGAVPYGRRIATDTGGDLLIMSSLGIVKLSVLVTGTVNPEQLYSTYKISNLFSRLVAQYGSLRGWAIRVHPEDNAILVAVPTADGQPTNQLAMSLVTKGWSQYRGLPLLSMDAWAGKMFYGTHDGRVCINTGYLDGVVLSDANAYTPIDCSGITRFSNLGRGTQKQITQIRPTIIAEGGQLGTSVQARYRYDLTEAALAQSTQAPGSSLWDSAVWDSSKWGGSYSTQENVSGAVGMGPDAAVAFRMSVTSRTVLIGFDVEYTESGGLT